MLVKKGICFSITVFIIFLSLSHEGLTREGRQVCFSCHTAFSEMGYSSSAHGQFSCSVCHKGLKLESHIKEQKPEREIWRRNLNSECKVCHDMKLLFEKPQHSSAILSGILCSECHDPHLTRSVRVEKKLKEERTYCITCHSNKGLKMKFKNGEVISVYVDEKEFSKSVHGKNRCTFCHSEFSKDRHPKRLYESKRDFIEQLSPKACARCHQDECKRYERCVHGAVSKRKREQFSPLCSDCHKPHYVKSKKDDKELHLIKCVDCHKDVYGAYKESVHYRAWEKGNKNAPLCTGCHKPHDVLVTSFNLKNNEVCFECHREIDKAHAKWFYNPPFKSSSFVRFHLDSITCNVCHSKEKQGAVYLHPYDKEKKTPITIESVQELLGINREKLGAHLDVNRDGYINASELWSLFRNLLDRKVTLTLLGWMDVRDPVLSHLTEPKNRALRDCEACHRADSIFFKDAFIIFRDSYGWPTVFRAHKDVLSTKSSLSPLSEFYVFGSTRLAIVDFLLILAVLGAVLVPSIHILLRLSTRKWRKKSIHHER